MFKSYSKPLNFFFNGIDSFLKVVYLDSSRVPYELKILNKLRRNLFFERSNLALEHFSSPAYWYHFELFFTNIFDYYFWFLKEYGKKEDDITLLDRPIRSFLTEIIFPFFRILPQALSDFYKYYPKFNISFDEVEFVYLDFGIKVPKVIHYLLGQALLLDNPILEKEFFEIDSFGVAARIENHDFGESRYSKYIYIYPSSAVVLLSREELNLHILKFFSVEPEEEKLFFKVILFYLEKRLLIKNEISDSLKEKGLEISEESLVNYFLTEYLFKDISLDTLRFIIANMDLSNKNPFKRGRDYFRLKCESGDDAAGALDRKFAGEEFVEAKRNLGSNPLLEVPVPANSSKEPKEE